MLRFSLFVVGMMAASTSIAGGVAQCSVDTVPIQVVGEGSGPVTTLSAATTGPKFGGVPGSAAEFAHRRRLEAAGPYANLGGVHFGSFVTAVTEHVAARLAKENLCLDNTDGKERSLLQFVHWPLVFWLDNTPRPLSVPPLDAPPSGGCRLSSPWLDLAFERKPVPWIRGIVRWNMRQLIADQAVLAGAQDVPPGVTIPMESREYRRFSDKYIDLLHLRWAAAYGFGDPEILSESAAKPFEEGIPSDLLWLFRRDNPSSFSGFAGGRAVIEKGAEGYTKLVIALIDRCLASDGADIRYSSILDIADPSLLEQYKINMPLTEIVIRRRKK